MQFAPAFASLPISVVAIRRVIDCVGAVTIRGLVVQEREMIENGYTIQPIGIIRSRLVSLDEAPRQGDEGGPEAWLELEAALIPGLLGVSPGDDLLVFTWLHRAQRDVLQVHPRGRLEASLTGVFATRSPDRPNPLGLHRVTVLEVIGPRLRVVPLEAIDGTPVVDIKPVIGGPEDR